LGSIQGGLLQPIQQHSWELFWDTDDPHQGHNVLFTVHPYASEVELGMYFPEEPELLESVVIGGEKPTYASPDKWTGGSPFEQIVQHENSLIVLYDIPPKTRFPHISGFFSRHLRHLEEHETGWIFAEAGRCLVAYYPLADYEWRDEIGGDRRLHSEANRNGAIVHVARKSDCGSLASFRQMILGCRVSVDVDSGVSATFESPSGDVIEARYGEVPKLNDVNVDYGSWPLRERTPIRR